MVKSVADGKNTVRSTARKRMATGRMDKVFDSLLTLRLTLDKIRSSDGHMDMIDSEIFGPQRSCPLTSLHIMRALTRILLFHTYFTVVDAFL